MTAAERARKVRRLRTVGAQLAKSQALYDERARLMRELADAGMTHREIGDIAGIGWKAVSKALLKQ